MNFKDDQIVIDSVSKMLEPILADQDLELVDVEFRREGRGKVLRVFMDKENGVTVDDCVLVSKELSYLLDVNDVISTKYTLEVSSPGLRRKLKKEEDFKKYLGKKVKIKTKDMIEDRRVFTGKLVGIKHKIVYIEVDKNIFCIPFDKINKANLELEF